MKEPLAREPHWLPSGTLLHVGGFYPFSSFLPVSLFNKVRPRGCLTFFFCTHFDSAEMRFLCGYIRCSHSKGTDGSWLPVRRADIEKYIRILSDIKISIIVCISISHWCWQHKSKIHSHLCFVLFQLIN